jgi:translation initiation factor 2 subunit 3
MIDPKRIPEVNIGTFGHVDHGKTTLVQALSGKRTDAHSEEKKRGITIRLGYADATFYKCPKCEVPYANNETCPKCFGKCEVARTVSFVDAPGHETLMATVLSGTALIDGALLLVDAKEGIKDQTREHLMVINISGIKNIVIVQNKIDLVTEQEAKKNYDEIKKMVKGTVAENAPIIPVSAQQCLNIDYLIQALEENMPTPERDSSKEPKFFIARSFDVNLPGIKPDKLHGGVVGGSLIQGVLKKGDEIEIKPGALIDGKWKTLKTRINGMKVAGQELEECHPGGLVGIMTELDPSLSKSDSLSGNVMGTAGKLPEILFDITIKKTILNNNEVKKDENIMLTCGVTRTVGTITELKKDKMGLKLKIPVCAEPGDRVVLSKHISGVWHLIGYGIIV